VKEYIEAKRNKDMFDLDKVKTEPGIGHTNKKPIKEEFFNEAVNHSENDLVAQNDLEVSAEDNYFAHPERNSTSVAFPESAQPQEKNTNSDFELLAFLASSNLPLSTANSENFLRFAKTLNPGFEIKSSFEWSCQQLFDRMQVKAWHFCNLQCTKVYCLFLI
jgi:hypothetical protein